MKGTLKSYRPALFFILRFVSLFLLLNTLYAVYIQSQYPEADWITKSVSDVVAGFVSWFGSPVTALPQTQLPYVALILNGRGVVQIFEGCNGLNVMIVYVAFLIAFMDNKRRTLRFLVLGCLGIVAMNILRVSLLYYVALEYPQRLYFFHKYLFTALIYAVVFFLWYVWVRGMSYGSQAGNRASK